MSTSFDFDLSELSDFEDVNLPDASDYADQTGPAPLAPGNYRFQVVEAGRRKNQEGEPIDDEGYPQFQLNKLTIVEPEDLKGRDIYPFQTYSLKPVQWGARKGTVPAIDLLRAFDDTLTAGSGKEVLQLLAQAIESGGTFVAGTNWIAKDSDAIKEAAEEAGGDLSTLDEEERKQLFKATIFRGQRRFPKVNGVYVPEVEGPSGATLEARVSLTRLYPSSKEVKKMGAYRNGKG